LPDDRHQRLPAAVAAITASVRQHDPCVLAVFVAGLLVNLPFSRMGFMPLDASIVFDGGWRILSGQIPWRDFTTPYGITPSVMQAAFFGLFGRTWLAFCLHSSVLNGAFAVLVYQLGAVLGLPRPLALFYALCSSFFFYPMVGVPFVDQHSFFFSLAAIAAATGGNLANSERVQRWLWASVPLLGLLAFLSKPVPFAFAALALPVLLFVPGRSRLRSRVAPLLAGLGLAAIGSAVLILVLGIPWSPMVEYLLVRPREVGALRTAGAAQLAERIIARYDNLPVALGLGFIGNAILLYRAAFVGLVLAGIWAIRRRDSEVTIDAWRLLSAMLLAPWAYFTSMLFGFVTNNQTQNSIAFYPVAAALLHAAVCAELRILENGARTWVTDRPIPPLARSTHTLLRAFMIVVLAGISFFPIRHWTLDVSTWTTRVNMTRMVNDMTFDFALAARSEGALPAGMEFLRWTPSPPTFDLQGWSDLVAFLRQHEGNVLIIGDTLVTYGLVGRPSVAANLWFHPGLTMPDPSEESFAAYEEDLMRRIARYDVRYIVVEGDGTRLGFDVGQAGRLSALLRADWVETHAFGPNRVYERIPRRPD
jgi:hypothetical protein